MLYLVFSSLSLFYLVAFWTVAFLPIRIVPIRVDSMALYLVGFDACSCVADNALGRTKKYIEISGRPGPAEFISPTFSGSLEVYNLTWSVESIPPLEEIRLLYRRLMVSQLKKKLL